MRTQICRLGLLLALLTASVRADEVVRQMQEELRKRNLYFGDIDGRATPDLANALKRYQTRKGFPVTGSIDSVTASALNIQFTAADAPPESALPDIPILKSDRAPRLSESDRIALEKAGEQNPDAVPTPIPPAESPSAEQDLTPARVTAFIEKYLRDGETSDIAAQTDYFTYPVKYFDDGLQDAAFVKRDVGYYVKHWPERHYTLLQPVTFAATGNDGETVVEFPVHYRVRRGKTVATGKTLNRWVIRPDGGELKIRAIHEQRVRE